MSGVPSKSSPLEVLLCSLLQSWVQPLPNSPTYHCRLPDTREHRCFHYWRRPGSTVHSKRTTGRFPTFPPCPNSWRDSCWHACGPTCSTLPISASSSRHTEKNTPWTYWRSWMESSRRSSQAGHCPDRPRSVGSLRHRRPPARVRSDGNPTPLAAVKSRRPDQVHQDGPTRITRHWSRRGRPSVCSLLQPNRRRHLLTQPSVSPIRRRHAAPSRHARRQHTRRAVRSSRATCRTV